MSKMNTICLRCGQVQVRTDIMEEITDKYIQLNNPIFCPRCKIKTERVATKDVEKLRQDLEEDSCRPLDSYIVKLIKR